MMKTHWRRYRHLETQLTQGLGTNPWPSHLLVGLNQGKGEPREEWMSVVARRLNVCEGNKGCESG